jgi:uncharacterized membrane protein
VSGIIVSVIATAGLVIAGLVGLRATDPERQTTIVAVVTIAFAVVIAGLVIGTQ